ncbi:MAG TPA: hypothetical protein DCQ30_01160 [Acidimicrobiaceae bacterium]|nr:hypothetical protein [Acidimicrobiaceae bacterium]
MTRALVLAVWATVAAGPVVCEVLALRGRGVAGLRTALGALSATGARRVLLFVGWMWVGWHFFAR